MPPSSEPPAREPSGDHDASPPSSTSRRPRAGRNLPLAVASGVALAAAFLGSLWWSPWALLVLILVLLLIALGELGKAFAQVGLRPWTPLVAGAAPVLMVGALVLGPAGQLLGIGVLFAAIVVRALVAGPGGGAPAERGADAGRGTFARGGAVVSAGVTLLMGLWVPFLASFSMLLADREGGEWLVLAVVALAVVYDIGAYAVGVVAGRHRLAPRVSPGKSWEGALGGLVIALALAGLGVARIPALDVVTALVLGGVVAVAATLGDLVESLVKRDVGIKDLGRVMPGHGGIMDRVDAILFALPAAHLVLVGAGV